MEKNRIYEKSEYLEYSENIYKQIHPISLLVIYFLSIFPVLLKPKVYFNLVYLFIPLFIYFYFGLKFKKFLSSLVASIIPALSYFLMSMLFSDIKIRGSEYFILSFTIFKLQVNIKIFNILLNYSIAASLRIFLLSFLSFTTSFMLDISELFKFLMTRKIISYKYGYALSIALNSIPYIGAEIKRISFLMKNRKIKPFFKGFLPVLIFGIRYSELATISLLSRGFSEKRTVFKIKKLKSNEFVCLLLISIIVFTMLLIGR